MRSTKFRAKGVFWLENLGASNYSKITAQKCENSTSFNWKTSLVKLPLVDHNFPLPWNPKYCLISGFFPHPTPLMSKRSILAYPTHTMTEPLGFPARFASNCRVLTSLPIQSVHVSDWAKLLACGDASGEVETVNLRKKQSAKFVSLITCIHTVSYCLQTLGLCIFLRSFWRAYYRRGLYSRGFTLPYLVYIPLTAA